MKKIILFSIFSFLLSFALVAQSSSAGGAGDGTATWKITEMPTGTLVVSLVTTQAFALGGGTLSLDLNIPALTTLTNYTPLLAGGTLPAASTFALATGSLYYNSVTSMPAFPVGETPVFSFKFTSTASSGTAGAFPINDDGFNYIELPDAATGTAAERQGVPVNNANAVILPIKLKKFLARPLVDKRGSDLRWTSSSEVNASHFEVERSTDATNFEFVGTVRATGNTNWDVDYSMIDNSLPIARTGNEIFYYRLKQVDLDGSFEYSDIRSVNFDNGISVKMGPNPTSSILNIHISSESNDITDAPAAIYDATGKLVMKKMINTNGVTTIDLSEVANGNYMVRINHNNKNYDTKIIKSN